MSSHMTGVFIDKCPNCGNEQEALVGYLSHCLKCGSDWRSYRKLTTQPITRYHSWFDENGKHNDFVPLPSMKEVDIDQAERDEADEESEKASDYFREHGSNY